MVKKGFVTSFCGAGSTADSKKQVPSYTKQESDLQVCFVFMRGHCCARLPSTVSYDVNMPSCVSTPWNDAFSDYHFLTHSCFPPSTGDFYCQLLNELASEMWF